MPMHGMIVGDLFSVEKMQNLSSCIILHILLQYKTIPVYSLFPTKPGLPLDECYQV